MKRMHLLCNAHLDPVWLWRKEEGIFEALSTFRVAADFCEEYDNFVFNHNEALLYEWVEKYDPALFERIKKLVAAGKWRIMGGWYLQPDCVMTSGESLLSQIELGKEYFMEKFGVTPTTAINFDPFGHSRGLVQILKITGYDSYIFMRPYELKGDFIWEGFDGSRIYAHGITSYNTLKGKAAEKVQYRVDNQEKKVELCTWGIGNHGGGPSRIDLENIDKVIKSSDTQIFHSYAENYFSESDKNNLEVRKCSLIPSMVGCYTTMVLIKQANRRLENKIAVTEKAMSFASLAASSEYCEEELKEAKKALAFCQFHDILPGTAIKAAEQDSLKTLSHGEEIADNLFIKALLVLCDGQKEAQDKTIPIMIFNPHPYDIEDDFEIGFMLEDQNWTENESTVATVYDENGNELATQNEKPDCTFNLDWIQKISFRAKVKASGITRFNCKLAAINKPVFGVNRDTPDKITVKNDRMEATINCKTGLIEKYAIDGKTLVENSGILEVYKDNEDPWGMTVNAFNDFEDTFRLMSSKEANEFTGYPDENTENVRIVEDGDVRVRIQSFWQYKSTKAVIEYTIPKKGIYIDVKIDLHSNEPNKMIKYHLGSAFEAVPYGQTAFGSEELYSNRQECVFHKWCALEGRDRSLAVFNEGIYGGDFSSNSIRLSLIRTPVYSAHPINDRPIAPHNRFLSHIDIGERSFRFRISNSESLERTAQLFNERPYVFSFFPCGKGEERESAVVIDNPNIIMSSLRKKGEKYILTLHNTSRDECNANIRFTGRKEPLSVDFKKHELKFVEI